MYSCVGASTILTIRTARPCFQKLAVLLVIPLNLNKVLPELIYVLLVGSGLPLSSLKTVLEDNVDPNHNERA